MPQMAKTFSRVIGRQVDYFQVPWEQFQEMAAMYRWFDEVGYEADITALRKEYPELTTLERYLRTHGWEDAAAPSSTGSFVGADLATTAEKRSDSNGEV